MCFLLLVGLLGDCHTAIAKLISKVNVKSCGILLFQPLFKMVFILVLPGGQTETETSVSIILRYKERRNADRCRDGMSKSKQASLGRCVVAMERTAFQVQPDIFSPCFRVLSSTC